MKNKPSQELIEKYLNGNATLEERRYVEAALNRHMDQSESLRTSKELVEASTRIKRNLFGNSEKPVLHLNRMLPYAAAAIILFLGFVLWRWQIKESKMAVDSAAEQQIVDAQQVLPGSNRATLSFDDGQGVTLDESQQGIVMSDGGITYRDGSSLRKDKSGIRPISHATLTTPKGGTYQITLPDGSKVWLNAASSLKYPVKFDDQKRIVELEGEAYFEVKPLKSKAKDKRALLTPFLVKTKRQVVEVLGTGFNVSDYDDEEETKTTLVEGSVNIIANNNTDSMLLSPGQQAVVSKNKTKVRNVDVEQFIAWKEGFFYFDRLPTQVALAQMARWYDIDVKYESTVPNAPIFGMIDRQKNLESVLKSLEISGLTFKLLEIKDRRTLVVLGEK